MFTLAAFSAFLYASTAFGAAVPSPRSLSLSSLKKRDDGCEAFLPNGVANNSDPFSLWIQYDESGEKVALELSTFRSDSDVERAFLAPINLGGVSVGNLFTLDDSGVIASGYDNSSWLSESVDDGGPVSFAVSNSSVDAGIAEDYCQVLNTDPNGSEYDGPLFAAWGTTEDFSVCNRTDNTLLQGLVFKSADYSEDYGFDYETCEPVHVYLRSDALGNPA